VDKTDTTLTTDGCKLHVASLNLATAGILDPSLGLGGLVDLDTTLANQGGFAQTNGTVKLSKALLVQGGTPASVPMNVDYSTKYDMRKNSGVLNPSTVKIGSATAKLNGTYAAQGDATVVDLKLAGDGMSAKDLQAFLPAIGVNLPKGTSLNAGTLSTNLNIKGPTNKLVTDGNIGLFNAKLEGFDLGSKNVSHFRVDGIEDRQGFGYREADHQRTHGSQWLARGELPRCGSQPGKSRGRRNAGCEKQFGLQGWPLRSPAAPSARLAEQEPAWAACWAGSAETKPAAARGGTTIPFMIQGTASDPKFVPDVGGVAAGMLKSQLGCAGGSLGNVAKPGGQSPADAINSLGGLFGKKKKP
jgi:hypothetical protein